MLKLSTKEITFIAIMAALGNVLSFISINLTPWMGNIPVGPYTISVAIDLSHLTTLIVAYFSGPLAGGVTGILGGMVAAYKFGFSSGNYITGFLLPVGKGLLGLSAGILYRKLNIKDDLGKHILVTLVSFTPEAGLICLIFLVLMPLYMGLPLIVAVPLTIQINIKAYLEMIIMGFLMSRMLRNRGFTDYITSMYD